MSLIYNSLIKYVFCFFSYTFLPKKTKYTFLLPNILNTWM